MDGREAAMLAWFVLSMAVVIFVYAKTRHWLPPTLVAITAVVAGYAAGVIS